MIQISFPCNLSHLAPTTALVDFTSAEMQLILNRLMSMEKRLREVGDDVRAVKERTGCTRVPAQQPPPMQIKFTHAQRRIARPAYMPNV